MPCNYAFPRTAVPACPPLYRLRHPCVARRRRLFATRPALIFALAAGTVFYSTPASFYTPPDLFRRARCIPRPAPRPFRRRTRDGQAVVFVVPLLPKRPRGKTGKRQSMFVPPAWTVRGTPALTTHISPRRADFRVFRQAFLQKGREPRAAAPCTVLPTRICMLCNYAFPRTAVPHAPRCTGSVTPALPAGAVFSQPARLLFLRLRPAPFFTARPRPFTPGPTFSAAPDASRAAALPIIAPPQAFLPPMCYTPAPTTVDYAPRNCSRPGRRAHEQETTRHHSS